MKPHYYDMILNSLSAGVILQNTDLEILFCNENAATILGLTKEQLLGKTTNDPDWAYFYEDGAPYLAQNHPSARTMREGVAIRNAVMGVKKTNQRMTWININSEPIFEGSAKTPDYVVVSFTDITDLKEKEKALKESNEELERFAYVASHDLQEPLRKVDTFLSLFLSKNQSPIDEKSKIYLDKVTESTERMKRLINNLLDFSRANNIKGEIENINCNIKINYIKDSYNMLPTDKKVIIESDNLPNIQGYKAQILSLFQNIINNGVKYNTSETPKITVRCEETKEHFLFSIADNGIGIAAEDYDKIFLPFHRLHGKSAYPGSGIGLATCKKIVEKHKGKLWVISELDKGSIFYFTIPK